MRAWIVAVALVSAACRDERTSTPPVKQAPTVAVDPTVPIDKIAPIAEYRDDKSPYDCTIIPAVASYFAGMRVENCGTLSLDATDAQKAAARACVEKAVAAKQPMLFAQEVRGEDSGVVRAMVARVEGTSYVAYVGDYDSNPCGGGCPEFGHTYIGRCAKPPTVSSSCYEEAVCFDCDPSTQVEQCAHGKPSTIARADAERARRALFAGPAPTTLGPAFGPIVLGAPSSVWTSPEGMSAREAIEAGGIVFVQDRTNAPRAATVGTIGLVFAGPCSHIRAELTQAWGAPVAPDRWIDGAAHRVAKLAVENCYLNVSTYTEPEQWVGKDLAAPFPLVGTGTKLKDWLAKVGGEVEDDRLRWRVAGLGTTGDGPIRMYGTVSHGRVVAWGTDGALSDAASIARLRTQLTKLLGPAKDDQGTLTWRGKPTVTFSSYGDTEFSLWVE